MKEIFQNVHYKNGVLCPKGMRTTKAWPKNQQDYSETRVRMKGILLMTEGEFQTPGLLPGCNEKTPGLWSSCGN